MQGGFNALGDGRFVSVVQQTRRREARSPALLIVVSSESAGAAQIEGTVELPTTNVWNDSRGTECVLSVDGLARTFGAADAVLIARDSVFEQQPLRWLRGRGRHRVHGRH